MAEVRRITEFGPTKSFPVLLLVLVLVTHASTSDGASHDKRNIVLILADDLGYADLGVQGGPKPEKINTPGYYTTDDYGRRGRVHPRASGRALLSLPSPFRRPQAARSNRELK